MFFSFFPFLNRVMEIGACHLSHISAAMFQNGKVYMWGHCKGHTVYAPLGTPYANLDDVFACYSNPSVTWRMLQFRNRQDTSLVASLRQAFDDPVIISILLLPLLDASAVCSMRDFLWFVFRRRATFAFK